GPARHIVDAVVSPDGRTLVAWSWHNPERDRGVQFFDAATGRPAKGFIAPDVKRVREARFTPDGKTVLIGVGDGIMVWDPVAGKRLRTLPGSTGHNLTFSPDGKTVVSIGPSGRDHPRGAVLHVWDLATGAPRPANAAEHGHLGEVQGVALTRDG